ncbi:MAG: trypsin-like peptidase domain-containing protein [Chloroflexota bacterium]
MKQASIRRTTLSFIFIAVFALTGCAGLFAEQESTIQPVNQVIEAVAPTDLEGTTATEAAPVAEDTAPLEEVVIVPAAQAEAPVAAQPAILDIFAQEQAFVQLFERSNPGVVRVQLTNGQGSGFVIDTQGHIVTNNHVVADGGPVAAVFSDGSVEEATVVGTDPQSDLAVIKVNVPANELTPIPLGNSDALKVGQFVIAIGTPFGLESTMTTGIVSGLSRSLPGGASAGAGRYQVPDVIQTDAAINPGNSGGPLLDLNGNVIGVNTAIESPVRGSSGVGFAVPVNVVKAVVPQLINNGRVQHPWLGISGGTLTPPVAEERGLDPELGGVVVSAVTAGGPAAQAGLQPEDIIIGVDGLDVNEFDDLLGYIVQHASVGQTLELQVLRNGIQQTIGVMLQPRPASSG